MAETRTNAARAARLLAAALAVLAVPLGQPLLLAPGGALERGQPLLAHSLQVILRQRVQTVQLRVNSVLLKDSRQQETRRGREVTFPSGLRTAAAATAVSLDATMA